MASHYVTTRPPVPEANASEAANLAASWEDAPTVSIPRWLMVLAARGEVTLRVAVDLEDDPIGELDDTATRS